MNETIASYSFLPWLRQGLTNNIREVDHDNAVILRASVQISLAVAATNVDGSTKDDIPPIEKPVELYGPGDIVGIDSKAIVKTEPRNWITNFEPNYLPYIDFYEEDFPWRYTPAKAEGDFLRPWITLVVLKEDEFSDGANMKDKPLPFFKLKDGKKTADIFPTPNELHAWAHVHVNTDLSSGAEPNAAVAGSVTGNLTNLLNGDPDQAYSRIICPRKLEPNIGYYAFLIPTFESGRLAGLGLPFPTDAVTKKIILPATKCGWEDEANIEFPFYHKWYFKTGNVGDFEYLVNLLQPKAADKRVGVRDMDVMHPGSNLPKIEDDLGGILKLGGALRVPLIKPTDDTPKAEKDYYDAVLKYEQWDEPYPHKFTEAMARRINLAIDYVDATKDIGTVNSAAAVPQIDDSNGGKINDPDPVITSPLYGRWHAIQNRLLYNNTGNYLPNNKNWIHELNLDPRFRVAAGFGTKVIQKKQEEYMQASWEQVGKIIEANNKLRTAQLAKEVTESYYQKHLLSLMTEKAFVFTAPVQKRIIYHGLTVHEHIQESIVPPVMLSGAFRSITRPRGAMMKRLSFKENIHSNNIIERVNEGEVVIVPPKTDPAGAINLSDIVNSITPADVPGYISEILRERYWMKYIPLFILLLLLILLFIYFSITGMILLAIIGSGLIWLYYKLNNYTRAIQATEEIDQAGAISQDSQKPEAVDHLPKSPNFTISEPRSGFVANSGNTDSVEAKNFKKALKDVYTLVNIRFAEPERKKLNLAAITESIINSLDPARTFPKRIFGTIQLPGRIKDNMVEQFTPVLVYPIIDAPMYKPLADISSELFLPNINFIEQNSITILENNQKFIESYMVGINHEMSRELLWREYPTDQRGTYFRQFWDVTSSLPPQPVPDDIKESLRDIPPIHKWHKTATTDNPIRNELGQHNQRVLTSGKTQLVLVVRGELLKKYPTAVVYTQKAEWGKINEVRNILAERELIEMIGNENDSLPANKIKMPLFEAKIEPDIYFFGFDLSATEALGTQSPTSLSDDPGWFFVIKERPGEPRFGLDIEKATNEEGEVRIFNWNDYSWKDMLTAEGACIRLTGDQASPTFSSNNFNPPEFGNDGENAASKDDIQASIKPNSNAAELAYILYQVPVLVAVHASRMLPK
jgi:hypothetical protein